MRFLSKLQLKYYIYDLFCIFTGGDKVLVFKPALVLVYLLTSLQHCAFKWWPL